MCKCDLIIDRRHRMRVYGLLYPSSSHNNTPKPTQIIPTPINVCRSGTFPSHTASIIATSPIVNRFATEDVVGPQIPIRTINPAFYTVISGSVKLEKLNPRREPLPMRPPRALYIC